MNHIMQTTSVFLHMYFFGSFFVFVLLLLFCIHSFKQELLFVEFYWHFEGQLTPKLLICAYLLTHHFLKVILYFILKPATNTLGSSQVFVALLQH